MMIQVSETPVAEQKPRDTLLAMMRGVRLRCPACGQGKLFARFVTVNKACPHCGEELHHHQADDAPAYFTIFIVGHVAVGGVLWAERAYMPSFWLQAAVWLTVAVVMSLWLLPRIKGILVGLQWALRMHGFAGPVDEHGHALAPVAARAPERGA